MHILPSLAAIAVLLPCVLAGVHAPTLEELKQTNRIKQVKAGKKLPGPVALANVYHKYKKQAPPAVIAAANSAAAVAMAVAATTTSTSTKTTSTSTQQSAAVAATNIPTDEAYYVNVTVGSTQMLLNLDTGSSDLWVFSSKLPASEKGTHKIYPLSGTVDSGQTWDITYGDGSGASGVVYVDKVAIGGVTATVQAVEAATSVSSALVVDKLDGLVGLGFEEGNTCYPYSCYGFMHQAGPNMPKAIFTATLKHAAPGEYDFGFIDPTKYTGALTYVNIADNQGGGYWEFLADGYSIGSGAEVTGQIDAIADTGTTLAVVDDAIVNAFYAPVTGAVYNSTYAAVIFPCTSASQLPELSYWISGTKHTMPGSYGNYGTVSSPKGYCYGGVQSNVNVGFTILGDVFLKSQFVVFDTCFSRIGWAQQAGVVV